MMTTGLMYRPTPSTLPNLMTTPLIALASCTAAAQLSALTRRQETQRSRSGRRRRATATTTFREAGGGRWEVECGTSITRGVANPKGHTKERK